MQTVLGPDGLPSKMPVVCNNPVLRWLALSGTLEFNAQRRTIKPFFQGAATGAGAGAPGAPRADAGAGAGAGAGARAPPRNVPPTGAGAGAPGAPRAGAGAGAITPPGTRAGRGSHAETGAPLRRTSDRNANPLPSPVVPEVLSKYQLTLINAMIIENGKQVTSACALQFKALNKQICTLTAQNSDMKTEITGLKKSNTSFKTKLAALEAAPRPQTVSSTPRPCEYLC